MRLTRFAIVLATLMIGVVRSAAAQEWILDLPASTAVKPITVQLPASGGRIALPLVRTGATAGSSITIRTTSFLSESGEQVVPTLSAPGATSAAPDQLALAAGTEPFIAANLVFPALPGPGPFVGTLLVFAGPATPARHFVAVTAGAASHPATLQVTPESDSRTFTMSLFADEAPPATLDPSIGPVFQLYVRDAAARWPLGSLNIAAPSVAKAPESFAPETQIAFYGSDKRKIDLPHATRSEGEALFMQLQARSAGEYVVTVPFVASNAGSEPKKVTVTVAARHPVSLALLCLSAALLLSFAASKLLQIRSDRIQLVERIRDLRPMWLVDEPETLAVVWVLSILNQASQLARRRLLPSLAVINKRLDTVEALVRAMTRLRRVRKDIEQSSLPTLARARALKMAERLADDLDPEMDATAFADHAAAVTDLAGWTRAGEAEKRYAADLSLAIGQLVATVDLKAIRSDARTTVQALLTQLTAATPQTLADLEARERAYATLKILWERRDTSEFPAILQLHVDGASLAQIFRAADDAAWNRLQNETGLMVSHSGARVPEAHDPLTFSFTTGDSDLDATYLVQHGLSYQWAFEVRGKKDVFTLRPSTRGPRVPQYAPFAGRLKPTLTVSYDRPRQKRESKDAHGAEIRISRSRRFAAVNGFSLGEILQLALAFAVAMITGLQTFYYKATGFGTLADYMGLFAWGTTVDQLKNFLQRLPSGVQPATSASSVVSAASSPSSSTAPAAQVPDPAVTRQNPPEEPQIPEPQTPNALNLGG
jgi:hypothetical protein